jgi:sigma-E factor negative regulatory protein RseC
MQLFCSTPRRFRVENSVNANPGDDVVVGVAEGAITRGVSLMYLLPLLSLLIGALLGTIWPGVTSGAAQDASAAVGAVLGLAIGIVLSKLLAARFAKERFQPCLIRHE